MRNSTKREDAKLLRRVRRNMAIDDRVQVSLRKSTVEMILGIDPSAATLDDAIEELLIRNPPRALLQELDREEKGPFVSLEELRRRRGD